MKEADSLEELNVDSTANMDLKGENVDWSRGSQKLF